jgi:hypothetical protein
MTAVKAVRFDDSIEFEEVKARAAKKSELGVDVTTSKKARNTQKKYG